MKLQLVFAALLLAASSGCGRAGWSYRSGEPVPTYPTAEPASGAYVVVPADIRVFMVQITSKQEELRAQLDELIAARDALRAAIGSAGELAEFQVADPFVEGVYPAREKQDSSRNSMMIRVSYKSPPDPLKQVSAFTKAVAAIQPPAGSKWTYSLRGVEWNLDTPEKHREKLVTKALDDLRLLRSNAWCQISVNGLEKPLVVSQCSDTEFLVSLPYTVTVQSVTGGPAPTP